MNYILVLNLALLLLGGFILVQAGYGRYKSAYEKWRKEGKVRFFQLLSSIVVVALLVAAVDVVFAAGYASEKWAILAEANFSAAAVIASLYLIILQKQANEDSNYNLLKVIGIIEKTSEATRREAERLTGISDELLRTTKESLPPPVAEEEPDDG